MAKIRKEDSALGATIDEIDLREPLKTKEVEFIKQSLAENEVIFFRDQEISPTQHKAFALNFGELQSHPVYPTVKGFPEITILENDEDNPSKIEEWHTDMTFRKIPPLGSILLGKIIPKEGGDTLFASLSTAFEGLPNDMKNSLKDMQAVHSFEYGFKESLEEPYGREKLKQALIATGIPWKGMEEKHKNFIKILQNVMENCSGVRRFGAAALDLAYVAAGRYDAFWEFGLKIWDIAAGSLLVKEAGGFIQDINEKENFLYTGNIFACNNSLNEEFKTRIIQISENAI